MQQRRLRMKGENYFALIGAFNRDLSPPKTRRSAAAAVSLTAAAASELQGPSHEPRDGLTQRRHSPQAHNAI